MRAAAIVDDLNISGPHASLLIALDHLAAESPSYGLFLGRPKCSLFWPHASPVPESLSSGCLLRSLKISKDGLPTLGALVSRDPVFSSEWYLRRVSESHKQLFECLVNPLLPSHHAFVILRSSVLPPFLSFSRRSS